VTHNLFTRFLNQNTCTTTRWWTHTKGPSGDNSPNIVSLTLQLWHTTCLQDFSIRIPAPQPGEGHKTRDQGEITHLILYYLPYNCDTQLVYKIPQSEYLHHNQGKDTKHLHSAEHTLQYQISCIFHTEKKIKMLSCKKYFEIWKDFLLKVFIIWMWSSFRFVILTTIMFITVTTTMSWIT